MILFAVNKLNRAGFTLIEILMVILLISILTLMGISQYIDVSSDAKTAMTNQKLNMIKVAIVGDARMVAAGKNTKQGYESHCLSAPSSIDDLVTKPSSGTCASVYDPFTKRGWRGPYLDSTGSSWKKDSWGTNIQVLNAGPPARTIRSCGKDTTCGSSDDLSLTY